VTSGNLPLTYLDSYKLKNRKVEKNLEFQKKKSIPKFIFRRSKAQKNPHFFFESRQVKELMDIFLMNRIEKKNSSECVAAVELGRKRKDLTLIIAITGCSVGQQR